MEFQRSSLDNRIRIPYNYVKLTFGMVHPSTFELFKTQFVFISSSNISTLGSSSVTDVEEPQVKRKRKVPRRYEDGSAEAEFFTNGRQYYR